MGSTPINFVCPVARKNQLFDPYVADRYGHRAGYSYPKGHERIVRTGRVRVNPSHNRTMRVLDQAHEYRCECGHVGWSIHHDMLRKPIEP